MDDPFPVITTLGKFLPDKFTGRQLIQINWLEKDITCTIHWIDGHSVEEDVYNKMLVLHLAKIKTGVEYEY